MEPKGSSSISSDRKTNKTTLASSAHARPNRKSTASSAMVMKPNGKSAVSSAILMKPNASTAPSSAHGDQVMFFRDVSLGPTEADLRFRLIHLWEARNPSTKTLIGQEMILIDEEGTVIQGFVPAGRVGLYELEPGSVYNLRNFFGSRNKAQYRVTDHSATVTFAWNSDLSILDNPPVLIHEDRFRFHSYEEFQANCDRKVDLYDYVGHMKLVNGQTITEHMVLDEVDIAERRHLCVHVQTHDGPVMKLYLWDKAASDFCEKFKSYGSSPRVLLVTTVNPKHLGGTLALTSMVSSRVFMDNDVQPSRDYLGWLSSNSDLANKINAEVVTKPETATLEELFAYIKQETAKVAWFECTATIDDVLRGSAWYYISCGGCNSKAVKGPSSLICNNKKCGKSDVTGVAQYLTRISVYDKSEQAVFVILGDAGKELTGKHASELVASYFEANEGVEADHCVPVPQALLDTIGHTYRFIVKVSDYNLSRKTQTITVTKILPPAAPQPIAASEEHAVPSTSDDILKTGGDRVRQASESLESAEAKRCKSG
ncbi:hypothetical protein HID58_016709 [Brassica napus]|uniref:Replication factor A C-terminal domain-containing protein n=3 Tax=Brassica TaxID=3705 RepID=A0ABQ8D5D2_BRANA|nr:hypothetical protein HID58_016709 [Brassica napus]CAG7878577.1 unnamed protein product [Brassica rapa]